MVLKSDITEVGLKLANALELVAELAGEVTTLSKSQARLRDIVEQLEKRLSDLAP